MDDQWDIFTVQSRKTVWQTFLFVYHCPFTPYFATDVPI
jgi:hypothetical protein